MSDLPIRDSVRLDEWLAVATKKLSTESVEHVREEIEEHFISAKEEALAASVHPHDTGLSALVSLGDPKAANRAYRKVLLTKAEELLLIRSRYNRPVVICMTAIFLVFALWSFITGFHESSHQNNESALLVGLVYLALALRPWIASKRNQTYSRIFSGFFIVCLVGFLFLMDSPQLQLGFSVSLIVIIVASWPTIRRCRQLRRKLPIEKWPDELYM